MPGRADQPELEGVRHQSATCAARAAAEVVRPGRAEELRLEAAAIAPVQADEVLDRAAVLEVGDAAEGEHGRSFGHAEVLRDLGRRGPRLHRARAAVELEARAPARTSRRASGRSCRARGSGRRANAACTRSSRRAARRAGTAAARAARSAPTPAARASRATCGETGSASSRSTFVSSRSPRALRSSWRLVSDCATNSDTFGCGDERALSLEPGDEAGSLEVAQRLADDGPAHVVALAERRLRRDLLARGRARRRRPRARAAGAAGSRTGPGRPCRSCPRSRSAPWAAARCLAHEDIVMTTCLHYNIARDNVGRCSRRPCSGLAR